MLICTCPIDESCPALGSQCDCFPWCDYLREDGADDGERKMVALEDIIDLDAQTAANNEAMRKVIAFMVGDKKEE